MDSQTVGRTILFLRNQYGMTQKELADKVGVTDKAVSRWERGVGSPDIALLTKLAIVLDTDIESILEGNLGRHNLKWKGQLYLNYPDFIKPTFFLYTKRIIYFQLSYFVLAGISQIEIFGDKEELESIANIMSSISDFGISYSLVEIEKGNNLHYGNNSNFGTFIISGLDFIYGKDVTRCFRRIMYECFTPQRIVSYNKKKTSMFFFPPQTDSKCNEFILDRGIIAFSVENHQDFLNAENLVSIIEQQTGECINNLEEIVKIRGLLK